MKKNYLALSLLALIGLGSCSKNGISELNESADRSNTVKRSAALDISSGHYILRPTKSDAASLDALRAKIESLGAKATAYLPELNMLFVSGGAEDFYTKFSNKEATVGYDLALDAPDVAFEEAAALDAEPEALGGDNPASIGDTEPFFRQGRMWGLDAIDAPQAWNLGLTGAGVTVAVLDEGFYPTHPDLAANFLMSKARNFVNLEDISTNPNICTLFPECDPNDVRFKLTGFSHGTHVAGTIAAVKNNIGTIGVAPAAKIIPVKVLSDFADGGIVSWIVQGIVYAANEGAQVINMSLGGLRIKGSGKNASAVQEGIRAYNDAIQYATSKGALVVCSAGNSGINFDAPYVDAEGNVTGSIVSFPAGSPQALSISATSPRGYTPANRAVDLDIPTTYTNYGNSAIDFAAPGGSGTGLDAVLSPAAVSGASAQYFYSSGTSMAAPHVSGVAALIIQKLGGSATPAELRRILRATSDDLGKAGRDPYFGHGRVNAQKAVQ